MSYWLSLWSLICMIITFIASADALWSCHCIRRMMKGRGGVHLLASLRRQ